MSEPLAKDYLDKLILLEGRVGAKVGYQFFEPPLYFDPSDPIALNKRAREIASFAGVKDLVTVATTAHSEECAGHIDLSDTSNGVFIEIANDLLDFPQCVLATLAHEVSHRFIQSHNLSCGIGPESHYHNEILTDITAVFLGLGKLMVNGCTVQTIVKTRGGTVTKSRRVGYLEPEQLAFVYLLVCAMRSIPALDYERGLQPGAVGRVRECQGKYAKRFFSAEFHGDQIKDALQAKVDRTQGEGMNKLELLEGKLRDLEQAYVSKTSEFLKKTRAEFRALSLPSLPASYDLALTFLLSVRANLNVLQLIDTSGRRFEEIERQTQLVSDLLAVAKRTARPRTIRRWRNWLGHLREKRANSP